MIKKLFPVGLLLHLAFINYLYAQDSAGQAGEFLRWGVGGKALGLGRAFTSLADDASALYWNPAGLSSLSNIGGTVMFMHVPLREGASVNYLAGAIPLRLFFVRNSDPGAFISAVQEIKIGLGFLWHSLGEFEFYNNDATRNTASDNSINESALYVSISYPLNSVLSGLGRSGKGWSKYFRGDFEIGLTTKLIRQDLFGTGGSATGFDLGFKYTHFSKIFNIGFALRDLNQPNFSYSGNLIGDEIPANATLGLSLRPPFPYLRGLLLSFDYGIMSPSGREQERSFGLEYDFATVNAEWPVKLRVGANSQHESFAVGLNFSPEMLWGQDWVPSADLTFANDRSRFDAAGTRYAISVDRNPFTAKYWYQSGMAEFSDYDCDNLDKIKDNEKILQYFQNAEAARNPGNRAYRYEASLRMADLNFFTKLSELQNSTDRQNLTRDFEKVSAEFSKRAKKYLTEDQGKSEVDRTEYFNSAIFYIQSLLLAGAEQKAIDVAADSGRVWGKKLNLFKNRTGEMNARQTDYLNYLHAIALYQANFRSDARNLIRKQLYHLPLAKFLYGHIAFLEGDYQETLTVLEDIDPNQPFFPEHIYLPITHDCSFGDEVQFLKAASLFKLDPDAEPLMYITEFAKIPRFFPNSDLSKFMTNGEGVLSELLDTYEAGDLDAVRKLVEKMIDSYIRSFSQGTLKEESYTYNYR